MNQRIRGFTLIEVAIVTLVLTLLLGGLLIPLAAQVDQRRYAETKKALDEIKDVLIGFAQVNGRLPCPANGDGEDLRKTNPTDCDGTFEGDLPWATLNVPMNDAWGRRFYYAVAPALTETAPLTKKEQTATNLEIWQSSQGAGTVLAKNIAAIVVSRGKNGLGAAGMASAPAATDEAENNDAKNQKFVSRTHTDGSPGCSDTTSGAPFCEFDDVVVWISPYLLFSRMTQIGHFNSP